MTIFISYLVLTLCFACLGTVFAMMTKVRAMAIDCEKARAATRKAGELHAELVDVQERIDGCEKSLKRLHSRAGMREVRELRTRRDEEAPDWQSNPAAWLEFAQRKLNVGLHNQRPPNGE
jgi:hypothetical protein